MQKEWDSLFAGTDFVGKPFAQWKTKQNVPFVAMVSGIGKVNAAVTAYRLIREYECTDIFSFGCAGGVNYNVHVGDVIVGDEYLYYDVNCGTPNAVGQVQGHPETFVSNYGNWKFLKGFKHGLIATGDTFVDSQLIAESICQILHPEHYPLAIDMESAAIAQVCEQWCVGFTSVRVVSDNPLLGEHTYSEFWTQKNKTFSDIFNRLLEEIEQEMP